jgi:PST family polysaccharide transporter
MWYFQATERMLPLAALNILSNVAAAAGIVLLVRSPQDYLVPLILRVAASSGVAATALFSIYRTLPIVFPTLPGCWAVLKRGASLFLMRGVVSLYTTANVLLFGLIGTPSALAWFAGAEKIAKAAVSGISPITQVFYPRITYLMAHDRSHASRVIRQSLAMTVGVGLCGGIALLSAAPILVRILLGSQFSASVPVVRLLAVLPPVIALSNALAIQWMLPLKLESDINRLVSLSGVLNIGLALILAPRYQQMGMAVSVAVAEISITASIIILLRQRKLHPWSTELSPSKEMAA